jgi:hypothetical protein
MSTPAWVEMRLALAGTLRLARGDRGALGCFDTSIEGFWRSFRAALICYPLYLLLLSFRVTEAKAEASGLLRIVVVETIAFVIAWVAFPLLIMQITRWIGREGYFLRFMVAYNWAQVPQTSLFVVIALVGAGGLLSSGLIQLVELVAALAVLAYLWFIARVGLGVASGAAALIVLVDVLLGSLLSRVTEALY